MDKLPIDFNYKIEKNSGEESVFYIQEVADESSAMDWLATWSKECKVTWRKRRTYPRAGRINAFKVDLMCQHATDKRVKGERMSKKTGCPVTLQICVKQCSDKVCEWPAEIKLSGSHNHVIDNPAALKYRDMSEDTKNKLQALFHDGHDPASALHCLKTDMLLEHGEDYFKFACDSHFVPSRSVVQKLFEKEFFNQYGSMTGDKMFKCLEEKLQEYNSKGSGKANFHQSSDGKHYFVVICTPLMFRAHKVISQSKELVLLDSSGGMDKDRHRLYLFVTPTAAGGIPLAAIVSDCEQNYIFQEALQKLKAILPKDSFFGNGYPQVFLTDNDMKERDALHANFPNSKLLLCQFHFLKALWSWLCFHKHNIKVNERQQLYFLFKSILYSKTEKEIEENHDNFLKDSTVSKYPNFIQHYLNLWSQRKDWATCYRSGLSMRGSNTTNYVEVVFRIMKDCVLQRVMAFSLIQFVTFLLTRFEMYFEKRLVDFCHERYKKCSLRNMLPHTTKAKFNLTYLEHGVYAVMEEGTENMFNVDLTNGMCTCFLGNTGKLCVHASYVVQNLDFQIFTAYNLFSTETKSRMFFVATGNSPPADWFQPLQLVGTSNSQLCTTYSVVSESVSSSYVTPTAKETKDHDAATVHSTPEIPHLSSDERGELQKFMERINIGLDTDPINYVPAIKKFLKNVKEYGSTEAGFLSGLHTFASYRGLQSVKCAKRLLTKSRNHGRAIGVQPTAPRRRMSNLPGKKPVSAGRPRNAKKVSNALRQHDYTSFGVLPKRKRKAPHDLQECVLSNKSLGK